jgi:alpha-galactosidase
MKKYVPVLFLLLLMFPVSCFAGGTVWLDTLEMDQAMQTYGHLQRNLNYLRQPLSIDSQTYPSGVGVWAKSQIWVDLGHGSGRFKADVGLDDASTQGSVEFVIAIDGQTVWRSGVMRHGDPVKHIDLDTNGKRYMVLAVEDGGDGNYQDWADWCNARWETQWSDPVEAHADRNNPYILTPPAPKSPRLNNPLIYGVRSGNPVQFTIPCTGVRPVTYHAQGLPNGLSLNSKTGWIIGTPTRVGHYQVTLKATNSSGTDTKEMEWVIGDQLALTPPMGWSSWNAWCTQPTQARVLAAAQSLVKFGLINHGFTYVNIDDGWQGLRGGKYNGIQANEKFPDFQAMLDQVHSLGLKIGVYSGPWICSYSGYTGGSSDNANGDWSPALTHLPDSGHTFGKYSFATNDAQEWASWGVDYLKYDWWPTEEPQVAEMSEALRKTHRNIIYSVSNSASLDKGPMLMKYAQLWRASGDIRDNWPSLYSNGFSQSPWAAYSGPGHWADPDMLVLGNIGFGSDWGSRTHPTGLTSDEQYTQMSLWCLLSAPLILGCDLTKLDPFTVSLLSNDEVIAVDQDPLGKPAVHITGDYFHDVWMRPLADGSYAVGIFNLAPGDFTVSVSLADLGLTGNYSVRDLWRQKDLGTFGTTFQTDIPGHGVCLIRLQKQK